MEIRTKRLLLRPLGLGDLATAYAYSSDPEATRFMVRLPVSDIAETKSFLRAAEAEWRREEPSYYEFAIVREGIHIGAVSVYLSAEGTEGELGWILDRRHWRHDYATEAAEAVRDFATGALGVRRLVAHCDAENFASRRVMEKLGMTLAGRTHGRINRAGGGPREEYMYALGAKGEERT